MANENDDRVHCYCVSNPIKHKKGFTLYKVKSLTFPRTFPEAVSEVIVWKRYSDFKKLHAHIKNIYLKFNLKDDFPSFAKANYFSRFEEDVIEERRRAALLLLEFISKYSCLYNSEEFLNFFKDGHTVIQQECLISVNDLTSKLDNASSDSFNQTPKIINVDKNSLIEEQNIPCGSNQILEKKIEQVNDEMHSDSVASFECNAKTSVGVGSIISKKLWDLTSIRSKISTFSSINDKPEYFSLAEQYVEEAELKESMKNYRAAFDLYKKAVSFWLSGVQNDMNRSRRKMIKEKTSKYLLRAEYLANYYLTDEVPVMSSMKVVPLSKLWQPVSCLVNYRVINVIQKVLLVMDMNTHTLCVAKALLKSLTLVSRNKKCILPRGGPYMVNLHAVFETDHAVYLVMEHISCGKLWDYIQPYFIKDPESYNAWNNYSNPYVGRKLSDGISESHSLSETQLEPLAFSLTDLTLNSSHSSLSSHNDSFVHFSQEPCPENYFSSFNQKVLNNGTTLESEIDCLPLKPQVIVESKESREAEIKTENKQEYFSGDSFLNDSFKNDTGLLVEKSQQLIKSVNETLMKSSSIIKIEDFDSSCTPNCVQVDLWEEKNDFSNEEDNCLSSNLCKVSNFMDNARLSPLLKRGVSPISSGSDLSDIHCAKWGNEGGGLRSQVVVKWASQLVVAINYLHSLGIILRDLNPENILITNQGNICLSYQCEFPGVEPILDSQAIEDCYTAPECIGIKPITFAVDWWSFGAILYHLITGYSLGHFHPGGFFQHSVLYIPDHVSHSSRSLLGQLLTYDPDMRLGSFQQGVEDIKNHLFFEGVDWETVMKEGIPG